jgi:putative membrane protein
VAEPEVVDATRRTRLANERTYLAWLRSALTALAVVVGAGKIVPGVTDVTHSPFELLAWLAAALGLATLALVFVH